VHYGASACGGAADERPGDLPDVPKPARVRATICPTTDVSAAITKAVAIADAHEHHDALPGHVLLALTEERCSIACLELSDQGIDVERLRRELVATLSRAYSDDDRVMLDDAAFPPLADRDVEGLTQELLIWKDACQRLRAGRGSMSNEEMENLRDQRAASRHAWTSLIDHHRYLAIAGARECADQGHRLAYAYGLALRALMDAVHRYTVGDEAFPTFADGVIRERLDGELGTDTQ
jgi:hypothetical protein